MTDRQPIITLGYGDDIQPTRLLRFGASLATVLGDRPLREDEVLEMRFELPEYDAVAEGLVQVRRCNQRPDGKYATLFRIIRMRPRQQALLERWYSETQLRLDLPPHRARALDSRVASMGSATRSRQPCSQGGRGAHLSSMASNRAGSGRAAIRAVLRSKAGEAEQAGPSPVQQPDPGIRVDLTRDPPLVTATYDEQTWRRDWHDWLVRALLFVQAPQPQPTLDTRFEVRISYPPMLELSCHGVVVTLHTSGFGLLLDANPQAVAADLPGLVPPTPPVEAPRGAPSHDEAFWVQMLGRGRQPEPLEAVLAALDDPLEPLGGLTALQRQELDRILNDPALDKLEMVDRVVLLLDEADWHWPELSGRCDKSDNPEDDAAAYIVLAAATRQQALERVRAAARRGAQVRLASGPDGFCRTCEPFVAGECPPLAQAHRGLPPYHLGCRCSIERA
jgi:hypothetical protein